MNKKLYDGQYSENGFYWYLRRRQSGTIGTTIGTKNHWREFLAYYAAMEQSEPIILSRSRNETQRITTSKEDRIHNQIDVDYSVYKHSVYITSLDSLDL